MKSWKATLITLSWLTTSCMTLAHAAPQGLDQIAVIVNDGVVLQSDIQSAVKTIHANAEKRNQTLPPDNVLYQQVTEKLIMDTIQEQEAKRIGVQIDDNRLAQAIKEIAENNKQSVEELHEAVTASGLSWGEYREQIRKEVMISEARNALVRRRINILPSEVDNMANLIAQETSAAVQYKISHIQLRVDEGDDKAAVEQQAQEIVKQLQDGADFATMAYTYSKGPKALQGGDWGWMRKEEMPTIFADQIQFQGKGTILGPFRSGVGFHILKIDDVKGLETVAVTEVNARHILIKPSVILSDEGAQKELNDFIRQIKEGKASFAELAKQYSQDPGSAIQGGALGYQTADLYVPEFKHQVETLPVGKISEPFKTVHGWHIVEVTGRRQVDRTDAALKNRAYRILFNRKFNEEATAWMQEMRASAYVEPVGGNQ